MLDFLLSASVAVVRCEFPSAFAFHASGRRPGSRGISGRGAGLLAERFRLQIIPLRILRGLHGSSVKLGRMTVDPTIFSTIDSYGLVEGKARSVSTSPR